eukprot:PhF_6_TR15415/c0_g1_i2/m.23899
MRNRAYTIYLTSVVCLFAFWVTMWSRSSSPPDDTHSNVPSLAPTQAAVPPQVMVNADSTSNPNPPSSQTLALSRDMNTHFEKCMTPQLEELLLRDPTPSLNSPKLIDTVPMAIDYLASGLQRLSSAFLANTNNTICKTRKNSVCAVLKSYLRYRTTVTHFFSSGIGSYASAGWHELFAKMFTPIHPTVSCSEVMGMPWGGFLCNPTSLRRMWPQGRSASFSCSPSTNLASCHKFQNVLIKEFQRNATWATQTSEGERSPILRLDIPLHECKSFFRKSFTSLETSPQQILFRFQWSGWKGGKKDKRQAFVSSHGFHTIFLELYSHGYVPSSYQHVGPGLFEFTFVHGTFYVDAEALY